ncbi:MAG: 3-phosphoshikimate 1-carboxyvinyltransferase [Dehalococcoidales bacterium]|nr:MAG: 3-phosphoshikimate 1-carboxyvinyltransferase [Dehalococcoidales bacterium]
MKASISKSIIKGSVIAPSSKSYTIRALICAALAEGKSEIINPLGSDDTEACQDILSALGVRIEQGDTSWLVEGGTLHQPDRDLYCRESAATQRFMTAVCSIVQGTCRLTSAPSLARRPVQPLIQPLHQLGIKCFNDEADSSITVNGGSLKGGVAELPGDISSQYVSALLFISPYAENGMTVRLTTSLESKPYVLMTLDCLEKFGVEVEYSDEMREYRTARQIYKPTRYTIEGDWSSASYLLTAGAVAGEVEVKNLKPNSLQGDKVLLNFLRDMGAMVDTSTNGISVKKSPLKACKVDLTDCIDLLPTMAVLAAMAEGTSEFTGIARARIKESNRVSAVKTGLEKSGIKVFEEKDKLMITGGEINSAVIDSNNDHRIAMAFSLLGLKSGNIEIENAECISKTYPEYWDILKRIGGEVKIDDK